MLSAGTSAWLVLLSHCSLPQRTETNIYPGRLLCIYSTAAFSSVNKYGGYRFPSINKYIGLPLFRSPLRNVLCTCLLFVSSVCVFRFLLIYSYFFVSSVSLHAWQRCPLLVTFLSAVFCLLSLLFFERILGLIWVGSV